MSSVLDKKFIKKLHKRLVETEKVFFVSRAESQSTVPSLEHLGEIISTMLWASTKLEEGRTLRFRVVYTEPFPVEHLALIFDFPPKKWSIEEIRRLAPAIPPPSGQIGIWPYQYFGLSIWGLSSSSLTGISFEALDPGRVVVRFPMTRPIADISGEQSGFINKDWDKAVSDLIMVRENREGNQSINQILSVLYGKITQEVLSQIRTLKHGGTVIFVPEGNIWKRSLEKPITYDCISRFNGIRHIENALRRELEIIANTIQEADAGEAILNKGLELLASPEYNAFITDATKTIAYLTTVDGTTILSRSFDVLAFGAKINIAQKVRKEETVTKFLPLDKGLDSESSLTYEFRGKRHLSAARFVISNTGSLAFVISQDGGITALATNDGVSSKTENRLLAYKGLELLV